MRFAKLYAFTGEFTMPRQFYTDDQRFAIFTRVTAARKEGKPWTEAFELAKDAGFQGGLPALHVYISRLRKTNRKARVAADKAVAASASPGPVDELGSAIERLVQERVRAALEKAIDVLKSAM